MGFVATLRPAASAVWPVATSPPNKLLPLKRSHNFPGKHASLLRSFSSSDKDLPYTTHASFNDEIIDRYDAFILDQFGVLHNGISALDGAVDLVEYLFRKNKKLIILSNTSAPANKALEKLPIFGFNKQHIQDAVTSGEESSRYVLNEFGSRDRTAKAIMFTWDASKPDNPRLTAFPEAYLEQCGNVEVATSIEEADFLLLHGSEVWYRGREQAHVSLSPFIEDGIFDNVDPVLAKCKARKLPAVCANPDFVVQMPSGDGVAYMPGKLARRYEEMGGTCHTFGKPAVEHFEACIRKLGLAKERVAHVGDSLHHDIAGAYEAGIPNVFVTSGIHKNQLGTEFGELPVAEELEKLLEKESGIVRPTHVVPAFRL